MAGPMGGAPEPGAIQSMLGMLAPGDMAEIPPTFAQSPVPGLAGLGGQTPSMTEQTSPGVSGGGFFTIADRYAAMQPSFGQMGPATPSGRIPTHVLPQQIPWQFQQGMNLPSTNNYRLLPPPYNRSGFSMRNGHIIDQQLADQFVNNWMRDHPVGAVGSGAARGVPMAFQPNRSSIGISYGGWPGQLEPYGILDPSGT